MENNIKLNNVVKSYKDNVVLKNINLTVGSQERIGIVGPNGSGKTTLCEIIAQLRPISSGEILINPNIKIGMQLQEAKYPKGITAWDLINYYLKTYELNKTVEEIQEFFYHLDVDKIVNRPIIDLSGGQQQKINILLALIVDADLLILDELATGLDLEVRERIYGLLEKVLTKKNLSLILISHNMYEIEKFCDKLIFMLNGEIISTHEVKEIIAKYGAVEKFVQEKFQDYKIGIYDQNNLNEKIAKSNSTEWAKSWNKHLKKQNKERKQDDK